MQNFVVELKPNKKEVHESFFKKDSVDQKSGFGFCHKESSVKSVLRSKISFWIHRN